MKSNKHISLVVSQAMISRMTIPEFILCGSVGELLKVFFNEMMVVIWRR